MKKIISLIAIIFFVALLVVKSYAQDNLTFSTVIKTENVGKAQLFLVINEWFASTYNSANNVIQMADKEAGIIVGNALFDYSYGKLVYGCYDGYIKYTIKVYIKDNRYKIELTNFNHSVQIGNSEYCSLGIITTADLYTTSGMSKKYHNNVWSNIKSKSETYSLGIFKSLENKTETISNIKNTDDW